MKYRAALLIGLNFIAAMPMLHGDEQSISPESPPKASVSPTPTQTESTRQDETPNEGQKEPRVPAATSIHEARARAMLLHESIRGTLQVVHRDFFDEDNAREIPSASLEDVFAELAASYDVKLKWLIVETDIVNVDHQPEDLFEKEAVIALKQGKQSHEGVVDSRYRFAGPIRLASQCLKCHVKQRTSTEDRTAGLLISMPLNTPLTIPQTMAR
ncbi:c-type heme family protein [Neorhodopirellula lusitana]|uniref:c-type heme family protein n=1 Tax=Neorhodopirellula lusitana TaxID=445327 RepID=UPI00384A7409